MPGQHSSMSQGKGRCWCDAGPQRIWDNLPQFPYLSTTRPVHQLKQHQSTAPGLLMLRQVGTAFLLLCSPNLHLQVKGVNSQHKVRASVCASACQCALTAVQCIVHACQCVCQW
jgi:hypothetical protein